MNTTSSSPDTFLNQLNESQHAAVTAPLGTQLVVAGAGSGKTRVITSRIAYLLSEHQVPPYSIVALTFTNKAGNEMKERIKRYLPSTQLPFVGTFHSYCVRLLRQHAALLDFEEFTILDADDQRALLKKIMQRHGIEKQVTPSKLQGMISFDKNHLPDQKPDTPPTVPFFKEVQAAYEHEKRLAHAYDFDDLLLVTLDLFKKNPAVRERWQNKVRHLLVDEYQDTNQIQHALLKMFAQNNKGNLVIDSVCAVGDQDQSIYSWRGAQADNMANFARDFAPVTQVNIEQNYRSVQPILEAANAVITHNPKRMEKKLWSSRPAQSRIISTYCQSGSQEAQMITQTINLARQRTSLSDVAVLYRTHHQSRLVEETLMHAGIPYVIIGGVRFYERKEIKDILGYLRLIANPFDRPSLLRIINTPTRGIGDKCVNMVLDLWEHEPLLNCVQVLQKLYDDPANGLNRNQRAGFGQLVTMLTMLPAQQTPTNLVNHVITSTGYRDHLRKQYEEPELTSRLDNLTELQQAVAVFEQEQPEQNLAGFLEHVVLMQEHMQDDDNAAEQVSLMTLHAAKGLEFDTVIISGLEEELFPSARAMTSSRDLEEERRLMYVGITRAKEYLLLTHSQLRAAYGSVTQQLPSRFLQEVPSSLITHHDMREESLLAFSQHVAQWLNVTPPAPMQTYSRPSVQRNYGGNQSSYTPRSYATPARKRTSQKAMGTPAQQPVWKKKAAEYRSTTPARSSAGGPWRTRMPVIHATFGVGIVQKVEHKSGDEYYLTISFKMGTKKLSSKFVKRT